MLKRRDLLIGAASSAAALAMPRMASSQSFPTVEEVLFDPEIPAQGNPEGKVTIGEFFDYQCPFCKRGHDDLMKVVEDNDDVRLVMKDWPIFRGASVYASNLVLAAGNRYEDALHAIMATSGKLTNEDVDRVLEEAGLDPAALLAAAKADARRIDGILLRNMSQASAFGLSGTPVFIVGRQLYNGAMDRQALEEAVAAARDNSS